MSMLRIVFFSFAFTSTAMVSQVAAEEPSGRGDRARTLLVLRIAEDLDLSDEKALQVSGVLKAAGERRKALRAERRALVPQLEAAVETADENALEPLIAKAAEIDRKLLLVPSESFAEIGQLLTVVERGKLSLLIPKIQSQLRRGARRGRPMRRGEWGEGPRRGPPE